MLLCIEFDDGNFFYAVGNKIVNIMRMKFLASAEELLLFSAVFVLNYNSFGKDLANKLFALCSAVGHLCFFCLIEALDDFFTSVVSKCAEKCSAKNFLFAVNLCIDKLFLLVDFELKPRSAVWNDAA